MIKIKKYYLLIIIFIAGCANPLPPSGGPPDTTPPVITGYSPARGTINYNEESVTIEFSKYMNTSSVMENIYISPETKVEYDWSGKELEIDFSEPLDSNTTYSINLGTEYSDLKGNKPVEAFSLIFSTGPHIDSGMIKGTLYGKNKDGAFIYAYFLKNIDPDTLDPRHTKPDYKVQVGKSGTFSINALKDGPYRIMAVYDQFKDGIYNEGIDGFGAPVSDIMVKKDSTPDVKLMIGPPIDLLRPELFGVESLERDLLAVDLSEKPDTASVTAQNFVITDSAGNKTEEVKAVYISAAAADRIILITDSPLDTNKTWKLTIPLNTSFPLRDSSGNIISDTANYKYFRVKGGIDTTHPKLTTLPFPDSTNDVSPETKINLIFNTAVDRGTLKQSVSLIQLPDSVNKDFYFDRIEDNLFRIKPLEKLLSDRWYILSINTGFISSVKGIKAKDTLIKISFKTLDTRSYGGASGVIEDSLGCSGNIMLQFESSDGKYKFKTRAGNGGDWSFNDLPPAEYQIEIFCDTDGNGAYSYGKAFPFKFAEYFRIIDKKFVVKPRWKIEDVILKIP